MSDILQGVGACDGWMVGVMVVMTCWSQLCEGWTVKAMVVMVCWS